MAYNYYKKPILTPGISVMTSWNLKRKAKSWQWDPQIHVHNYCLFDFYLAPRKVCTGSTFLITSTLNTNSPFPGAWVLGKAFMFNFFSVHCTPGVQLLFLPSFYKTGIRTFESFGRKLGVPSYKEAERKLATSCSIPKLHFQQPWTNLFTLLKKCCS